jgi:hypothetical protein
MRKEESVYKNKSLYCDLDKKGMIVTGFAQVDNNTMKELCIDFHPNVAIVYFMLISHRHGKKDENYNQCFPTKDMLSKETGLSEKTVIKCIKTLADNEYILYRQGNSQLANQYFFPLEEFYQGEGDYLLNVVEDIIDVDTEDIPTEDNNNLPFLSGDILEDKETFTPKGKYVNEIDNDGIFDDILPPINSSDGYVKVFYDNMVKYYKITDETLANNNHIDKKINSLIGYVKEELVKNDILDITAEKVITDILKGNRKSFTTSLAGKNFPKQFYKYVYLISCIQNNFTKKKLTALIKKHNKAKVADKVVDKVDNSIDGNLAESMNDNYITLSNGDNLTKDEAINRMKSIIKNEEQYVKDTANSIVNDVMKSYKKSFDNAPIQAIRDIVNRLNIFYKREFLLDER